MLGHRGQALVKPLYKSTVVIWSSFDPANFELSGLSREAEQGEAYCSVFRTRRIRRPLQDPDWDGTEFFDSRCEEAAEETAEEPQ